ncbi:MAG: hypothetical protein ACI92S_004940, partial [Planctomycetaceae bacterium]
MGVVGFSSGVTSGANQTAGVPARATFVSPKRTTVGK